MQLENEPDDAGRAEVLTQLARVEGLRDDFDACDRLLEQAEALAGSSAVAKVRINLERGRSLRSSGDPAAALPLLNNLGWSYFDAGEHEQALELFERALEVRRRDPANQDAIAFAEEAVRTAREALS